MEEMEKKTISNEAAHEIIVAVMERQVKRLFILCIILFIALVGTNAYWIWNETSYQDVVVTENSQDGEGINIMGGGDISYGAENENGQDKGKEEW
jgi:cell division septal protein FtsQ